MKIRQIEVNRENLLEMFEKENLYVVKMTKKTYNRKSVTPYPYGLSFKSLQSQYTIAEVMEMLDGNACIVEVTEN